jgi:hypothetical protein
MNQGITTYLANDELIAQLTLRDDLTPLEHDLLDRLIRADQVIKDSEAAPQPELIA